MNRSQFLVALHTLFELDAGAIQESSELQQIDGWNSLTFIGLIAMIDEEFGVAMTPGVILKSKTVADLIAAVSAELAPLRMAA